MRYATVPARIAEMRKPAGRSDLAVTVTDHRDAPGLRPPPRTHTERVRTMHQRNCYVRELRRTVEASGGRLVAEIRPGVPALFHVYEG